jgi:hypothetical protein
MVEFTVIHCRRKSLQQHHQQRINSSTKMKMFTSPDNFDLSHLSTVFEVCDNGGGNIEISK